MDIEEFSRCLGLSDEVLTSVDEVVHASLMKMIHLYLVVGGMPAAVQAYVDTIDLNVVEEKQKEILDLYKWDISQYDPNKKLINMNSLKFFTISILLDFGKMRLYFCSTAKTESVWTSSTSLKKSS